jgi:hypothetical protein
MIATDINKLNRFPAFGIHLGLSFVIFVVLAYLVIFVWYPSFFFDTDGGWRGMQIIVGIDLVLGPMLTLVVFKAGKPELKWDLTLIGIFQATCLFAGTYIVYAECPIAIVYVLGEFHVTSADDYSDTGLPNLDDVAGNPKWIAVSLPDDLDAAVAIKRQYVERGQTLYSASEHYRPFNPEDPVFVTASEDWAIIAQNDERKNFIQPFLEEHGGELTDYRFYPYSTRYQYTYSLPIHLYGV